MNAWCRLHLRAAIRAWREEHPDDPFPAKFLLAAIDEWETTAEKGSSAP